ncbi:MAG: ribose-phosphate pyrophosphokinase [Candidatus Hydrogenedentes bacterium]|nr:ribose-phosphate pyrophosphokinase [Candidatus Hydrogenedentota bacterium]
MDPNGILIFGGSGSPKLAGRICEHLGVPLGRSEVLRFSEGNLFVRVQENVRGRRCYLIQSTAFPANDNFMEMLFWIDALKRASADSVTVIMPYFSYAKGDKKDEPRVSIRARVCADAIEAAGADRVVTLDLHAPQIQGFFRIPVDDLYALPVLGKAAKSKKLRDLVVVSPDTGFVKQARRYATLLNAPLAIGDKQRTNHDESAEVLQIMGDVKGKTALVVDDFTISGGTLVEMAETLIERGAETVYAAVTHGVFSPAAKERIDNSPITKLLVTDSIETQPSPISDKVEFVSIAPFLAEAIRRIHNRESISVLFTNV